MLLLWIGGPMTQGTVKWFSLSKGFGFIIPDDGTADVFVHISAVERSGYRRLEENQRVEFTTISQGPGGRKTAQQLRLI
jgi:cold shock protein